MSSVERRRHKRYPCSARVEISWGHVRMEATMRDISASGMYIETSEPLWNRAEFSVRLLLPDAFTAQCVVRRVDASQGMTVEFTELNQEARMNLTHLLWKLARQ